MFKVLRPLDLASVGIITLAASTGVSASLGLTDAASIVALTMGLTCPAARRLIAWRRGAAPVRIGTGGHSMSVVAFAMLPWMLLPVVHSLPWQALAGLTTVRLELPEVVRWAGVALTIAGVLRPMAATLAGSGSIRSTAYVETIGLFFATGNLFLGVMAAAWVLVSGIVVTRDGASDRAALDRAVALA